MKTFSPRLTAIEDSTVERKTVSDNRDWIKAAVAFSNSLEIDQPGVLFIGVHDSGNIQERDTNFEDLQKKVSGELSNVYPPIYPTILVREKNGKKQKAGPGAGRSRSHPYATLLRENVCLPKTQSAKDCHLTFQSTECRGGGLHDLGPIRVPAHQDKRGVSVVNLGYFNAMRSGQECVIAWTPGVGLETKVAGVDKPAIYDKSLGSAIFAIWLGDKPVQEDLKKDLVEMLK
jgi:hypothetical protein